MSGLKIRLPMVNAITIEAVGLGLIFGFILCMLTYMIDLATKGGDFK
jgi:hypothetical protein